MKRWPLHPKPNTYEWLDCYVRRLAGCYGVSYECFLRKALNMSMLELQEYKVTHLLSPIALQLLSNGTGVRVRRLKLMTPSNVWKRLMRNIERTMTPDETKGA